MGKKMTKAQRAKRSKKKAQRKIKTMEKQDSLGINRKELRFGISPRIWVILKLVGIVSIPIAYVIYSPLLIVCMVYEIAMIAFSTMAERNINHTYVKSRHIKIHKLDSVLAVIVILITFASTIISANTKKKMPFDKFGNSVVRSVESFCSCSTGSRSVIRKLSMKLKAPSFGGMAPPAGMPPMGQRKKLEISDLPIEMVFSMAVSSVNTCLVFMVPATSGITLLLYFRRKKKFDHDMNEIVIDALPELDDASLERIFSFGLEEIESQEENNIIEQSIIEE